MNITSTDAAFIGTHGATGLRHVTTPVDDVSVIVLCYNHAAFVTKALDSVLAQRAGFELLVVDDASRDDSVGIIQGWLARHSLPHRLIVHTANWGVCASLNQGFRLARGRYVRVLAADDLFVTGSLEAQRAALELLPTTVAAVYSDAYLTDEYDTMRPGRFVTHHRPDIERLPSGDLFSTLLKGNFIPSMTCMIRRACWEDVGGYDEGLWFEDWDFWLRVTLKYDIVALEGPLAIYRFLETSLSRSKGVEEYGAECFRIIAKLAELPWSAYGRARLHRAAILDRLMRFDEPHARHYALLLVGTPKIHLRLRLAAAIRTSPLGRWLLDQMAVLRTR